MAKRKPSINELLEQAYAIGYGDAHRDTMRYWENPTVHGVRRYVARKRTVVKALLDNPEPLKPTWAKEKHGK